LISVYYYNTYTLSILFILCFSKAFRSIRFFSI
jgi:hypothetical protein